MSDSNQSFKLTPEQINADNYTYTPSIEQTETNKLAVTLSISHQESEGLLLAEDIEVTLIDNGGAEFSSSSKSTGELVQVGGSLGVTSSYEIVFDLDDHTPKTLIVKHLNVSSEFAVSLK